MAQHDPHNQSDQGWKYSTDSGAPAGGGDPTPPKKGFDIGEWIPIIVLLCIPSGITQIIAVIWALKKVSEMMSRAQKEKLGRDVRRAAGHVKRGVEDAFRDLGGQNPRQEQSARQSQKTASGGNANPYSSNMRYSTRPEPQPAAKKAVKLRGGKGLVVSGSILTGLFGLSSVVTSLEFFQHGDPDDLTATVICALFCAGGAVMLALGIGKTRRRERFRNYLAYIGSNSAVSLAPMAASFGVSVRALCKDLRRMLSDKILPTGYLDLAEGKLILTETGYRAPEPEPARDESWEDEDEILREIRRINDDIPDEAMSAKIDRIGEITARILAYQRSHPQRGSQLRSFLNYYLPTTLKILRAYAQLDAQGVEGENISAAKARIEGMMDQVVAGFEKQLDRLFQDDAMDISSDVQVLENMLKKDGLSGDGQTMSL